ncbi:MAG: urease accessory protein UreD [Verrucomicrobiota bacterium]
MSICSSNEVAAGCTQAVSGSSLNGHLQLRCENRADGTPYISRQSFRAPIHIGKALLDGGRLLLNIANPTAGFFDGDRVTTDVTVATGARLILSTPAAARVYQTRSGRAAANYQQFHLAEHAMLEWIPEPFIPHAGASYVQTTHLHLQASSTLLFFEWLAPGRVASGEVFAYQNLRWQLDLSVADQLVARERYNLRPDNHSLEALRGRFPAAHYLSVYAAGTMTRQWPADPLDALSNDDVLLGHGPLQCGVHVIRALCRDSLTARGLLEKLRHLLYAGAGQQPPNLGRL